jgi:hypothetical protein
MKVKLRTTMAGPEGVHLAGKEVDLPDDQAEDLLLHGFADFVRTDEAETAVEPPPEESAVKAESKRRRGDRRISPPIDMATNTEIGEP